MMKPMNVSFPWLTMNRMVLHSGAAASASSYEPLSDFFVQ
jgi:hypothetical protein